MDIEQELEKANRLSAITEQVGFALWQLQELEGVCATYFVLVEQATLGMGEETGNSLEKNAKRKTFGTTIHKLAKAGLLSLDIESRFTKLLSERNWLVHRSRAGSRNAIHHESEMLVLIERLRSISDESLSLLKYIGKLTEDYVKKHNVSEEYINMKSNEILNEWHSISKTDGK